MLVSYGNKVKDVLTAAFFASCSCALVSLLVGVIDSAMDAAIGF